MRTNNINQDIKEAFKTIEESLKTFQKLDPKVQEKNRLVLKNILLNIISIVKFILLKIGHLIECDIKPTHSISRKLEIINSANKSLLKENMEFLVNIHKFRNKYEHNDLELPKLVLIIKTINELKKLIQDIDDNIFNLHYLKDNFNSYLKKAENKIQSLKEFISKEHFNSLVREADLINSLPSNNLEYIKICREKLYTLVLDLNNIFPFSNKFTETISNISLSLSKDPFKIIERYWFKISNNQECPICGSQELTNNFWICREYPSIKKEFISIVPFKVKKNEINAFISNETWENGRYCDCEHLEECNRLNENNNQPIGSKFCNDCGFYFLPSIETGLVQDFTAYWLDHLPSWD